MPRYPPKPEATPKDFELPPLDHNAADPQEDIHQLARRLAKQVSQEANEFERLKTEEAEATEEEEVEEEVERLERGNKAEAPEHYEEEAEPLHRDHKDSDSSESENEEQYEEAQETPEALRAKEFQRQNSGDEKQEPILLPPVEPPVELGNQDNQQPDPNMPLLNQDDLDGQDGQDQAAPDATAPDTVAPDVTDQQVADVKELSETEKELNQKQLPAEEEQNLTSLQDTNNMELETNSDPFYIKYRVPISLAILAGSIISAIIGFSKLMNPTLSYTVFFMSMIANAAYNIYCMGYKPEIADIANLEERQLKNILSNIERYFILAANHRLIQQMLQEITAAGGSVDEIQRKQKLVKKLYFSLSVYINDCKKSIEEFITTFFT